MMKWRFREGKLENFVHPSSTIKVAGMLSIRPMWTIIHFKSYPFQTLFELGYPNLNSATVNCWVWWLMCTFFKNFMLKGPGENLVCIRFSIEQKKQNKLFSLFTTFFEVLQNWHKIQLSLFSIASKLNWALVFFLIQQ